MRAFAQKQNQPQKGVSSSLARSNTQTSGPTHHAYPTLVLQRAIGNQAVQRVLQTHAEELEVGLITAASPRFGHDFSQISIHPPAARATQTKPAFNKPGDEHEQEANAKEEMGEMGAIRSATISAPAAPSLQSDFTRIPITAPLIPRKPTVSFPGDPFEREAEDVADKVMRTAEPASIDLMPPAIHGKFAEGEDEERKPLLTKRAPSANTEAGLDAEAAVRATERGGAPLSREVRSFFELYFRHDFSGVRVHADSEAANAASAVRARAYTIGRDIVFGSGEYAPATTKGKRLLAHELAHVVQQEQRPHRGVVMRQQAAAQQAPARLATVAEAAEFLEDMVRFIEAARAFALALVQPTSGTPTTPAARQRAYRTLNQQRLRDLLANARTAFAVQEPALQSADPHGTRLRTALLGVVMKIREVAPDALGISDGMPAPTPDNERRLNAELVVELIEADPFTSAGMVGTPAFGAAETGAGASHEAFIEAYLDDLIRTLPGQTLAPADRDRILQRISAALRRAFLTVGTGPAGTPDIRAITNPAIVVKYRRVTELLSAGMSARPAQLSIITLSLPAYVLPPDPVPDVTPQLEASPNIGTVDLSRVPAIELPYVRFGVLQAANTIFPATSIQRQNASWTVALQVRRGGNVVRVRYDLIFDDATNVRVERLGEAGPREVDPTFAQLTVPEKKQQLVADFALAGVDDRPAAPGRPAAVWTAVELDQVKAAYDLIPPSDRPALRGVTIVRDRHGPAPAGGGQVLLGFAHTSADPAHDEPGPPPHPPPHIHYYDDAFALNTITAVGGPGSTGPGADWTIAHEVGHMRIFLATRQANAAVTAANALIAAANQGLPALNAPLPPAQHQVRQAYGQARAAANTAIQALNAAIIRNPPAAPADRAQLLQTAQTAVAARNQARANLAAAGVPPAMVQAATNFDAAADALLAATQSGSVAMDQIPTFVSLAATFGFTPFTDHARSSGDEFFAEAYTLFLTDPSRLSAMNRSIFLWFEAGMPMNPGWRPPP